MSLKDIKIKIGTSDSIRIQERVDADIIDVSLETRMMSHIEVRTFSLEPEAIIALGKAWAELVAWAGPGPGLGKETL